MSHAVALAYVCIVSYIFGESHGNSNFGNLKLPDNFDDDSSFDNSGFIPQVDFSDFFKRVDFDRRLDGRSLDAVFEPPGFYQGVSFRENEEGKNKSL